MNPTQETNRQPRAESNDSKGDLESNVDSPAEQYAATRGENRATDGVIEDWEHYF